MALNNLPCMLTAPVYPSSTTGPPASIAVPARPEAGPGPASSLLIEWAPIDAIDYPLGVYNRPYEPMVFRCGCDRGMRTITHNQIWSIYLRDDCCDCCGAHFCQSVGVAHRLVNVGSSTSISLRGVTLRYYFNGPDVSPFFASITPNQIFKWSCDDATTGACAEANMLCALLQACTVQREICAPALMQQQCCLHG